MDYPGEIIRSGPKYQYPYATDGVHLVAEGYRLLGEKYGQVYYERVVRGRNWQPLHPIEVKRDEGSIDVRSYVPVPSLVWSDGLPAPHQSEAGYAEWQQGRGFGVRSGGTPVEIGSVGIIDYVVRIACATTIPTDAVIGCAATAHGEPMPSGTTRWGLLRDSNPVVGATTGMPQPNDAVAFELPVP